MAWTWVNDLLAPKKDMTWDARCPYHLCPSNQPFRGAGKPRLKFVQKVSPMVYQYQCKDCGCPMNVGVEVPSTKDINPALIGKPDYQFHV